MQNMGLVAPYHVESEFPDQGLNLYTSIGRQNLNHWATWEIPEDDLSSEPRPPNLLL